MSKIAGRGPAYPEPGGYFALLRPPADKQSVQDQALPGSLWGPGAGLAVRRPVARRRP